MNVDHYLLPITPYILLIDDSKEDAMLIERTVIKSNQNLSFKWIGDAEVACSLLLSQELNNCKMIIMDIKMPKITGLEILEVLGEKNQLQRLPQIIIYSSSNQQKDIDFVKKFKGVKFKTKPEGYIETRTWLTPILSEL